MELADVDGDGSLDALAVTRPGLDALVTHLGVGDGTFGPLLWQGVGDTPESLWVGDLDGDAFADAVVGHAPAPVMTWSTWVLHGR